MEIGSKDLDFAFAHSLAEELVVAVAEWMVVGSVMFGMEVTKVEEDHLHSRNQSYSCLQPEDQNYNRLHFEGVLEEGWP